MVMNGLAMTAGSKPSFLATIGSVQPTTFATSTVTAIVAHTTKAVRAVMSVLPSRSRSKTMIFAKHSAASATPHSTAVWISFHTTLGRSRSSSSPRDRARITVTDAWEPELPPVSISMGMKAVSTTWAASLLSKPVIIMPVNVADTISSISHGMRCLNRSQGVERR